MLFKVAGSINPVTAADVRIVSRDELVGQVTSGQFCGTGTSYTLHFVALFDRPFSTAGTWTSSGVSPHASSCSGPTCGAYVTFDPSTGRDVLLKVGISFVSTADARENLRAEDPGWSVAGVSARARHAWDALLGRITVSGGTEAQRHIFYTALYHSLLFPNVVSDVNGDYPGSDGKVHAARAVVRSTPTSRSGTSTAAKSSSSPCSPRDGSGTWSSPSSTTPNREGGCPNGPSSAGTRCR